MRGPSHVVFGLAGAVVAESIFHVTTPPLFPLPSDPGTLANTLAAKIVFYGFAALGALAPDIDNARSTIGMRAGFVSKGIQRVAGHRTFFHSLFGLAVVGALIWAAQYSIGLFLYDQLGLAAGEQLASGVGPDANFHSGVGIAFAGFLIGYFLHLVADSLTLGGVPWLWPNRTRFGFPPERSWRFKTGSAEEPVVVVAVAVLVILGLLLGKLIM
ncbi:MAG: metal-dependent hydrolase [Ktedonobacterales bacterium]